MKTLICTCCGCEWPAELHDSWGRTVETDGYGPTMRCVELVPDRFQEPVEGGAIPLQVCGGTLSFLRDGDAARVHVITPLLS